MANVNTTAVQLAPNGGGTNAGRRIFILDATTKAAQNDTITITNVKTITHANLQIVATGAAETYTVSGNVITLTSATTGSVRGTIIAA